MNHLLFSKIVPIVLLFSLPFLGCCQQKSNVENSKIFESMNKTTSPTSQTKQVDTATFAAGCFWCVEAQFKELNGVISVTSGFTGGNVANPSYEEVCTGTTGHAEACNIVYDPKIISFDQLLAAFFVAHDPTQLNRQGNDEGTQYRSAIFYHNEDQKRLANYYIQKLNEEKAYPNPIVTEVTKYAKFYKAEDYHQDYFANNGNQPYCKMVIQPEVTKFKKVFKDKLKK